MINICITQNIHFSRESRLKKRETIEECMAITLALSLTNYLKGNPSLSW